jgi:hypothetical protein
MEVEAIRQFSGNLSDPQIAYVVTRVCEEYFMYFSPLP